MKRRSIVVPALTTIGTRGVVTRGSDTRRLGVSWPLDEAAADQDHRPEHRRHREPNLGFLPWECRGPSHHVLVRRSRQPGWVVAPLPRLMSTRVWPPDPGMCLSTGAALDAGDVLPSRVCLHHRGLFPLRESRDHELVRSDQPEAGPCTHWPPFHVKQCGARGGSTAPPGTRHQAHPGSTRARRAPHRSVGRPPPAHLGRHACQTRTPTAPPAPPPAHHGRHACQTRTPAAPPAPVIEAAGAARVPNAHPTAPPALPRCEPSNKRTELAPPRRR